MNDFLQALRTNRSERQRTVMTRKSYDATYNSRTPGSADEITVSRIQIAVESLNANFGILAENQKYLIDAQERVADSLERQAMALERILSHLNIS